MGTNQGRKSLYFNEEKSLEGLLAEEMIFMSAFVNLNLDCEKLKPYTLPRLFFLFCLRKAPSQTLADGVGSLLDSWLIVTVARKSLTRLTAIIRYKLFNNEATISLTFPKTTSI